MATHSPQHRPPSRVRESEKQFNLRSAKVTPVDPPTGADDVRLSEALTGKENTDHDDS